jgi:choline dehydrogenase-like flavoprotein
MTISMDLDVLVIGSGPGGALTAARLAEAGRQVTVLEEGDWIDQGSVPQFSLQQMTAQYRNAGLTVAMGRPPIAYSEGRCAGGGSEVNSALYHRPSPELIERWARAWRIADFTPDDLEPHVKEIEAALSVSPVPGAATPASQALAAGAERLGWAAVEVPRWMRYPDDVPAYRGERQSMTRTYLPRARAAGAEVLTGYRVDRLVLGPGRARGAVATRRAENGSEPVTIRFNQVVVCCGAIQTPALLQRSGIRKLVGRTLTIHPMVKAVARFPDEVNIPDDVPVHQVKEFSPYLSFGGSASRPGLMALALVPAWDSFRGVLDDWRRSVVYYAAITTEGRGRVIALPGLRDPVVTYSLTRADGALLGQGLSRLVHLLLAAGAEKVYPSIRSGCVVRTKADEAELSSRFRIADASLMTVHLCSTVPMGEDERRCATDSFGRLRGFENIWVNDASLLPDAPGVNPQGTIMAVAARNSACFLAST